ncbi:unnamed protein product, partial [Staurois parvus]
MGTGGRHFCAQVGGTAGHRWVELLRTGNCISQGPACHWTRLITW